jgi:hypothetical protein
MTTLVLSLCCAACVSCRTRDEIRPAIHQGPQGNAVLATLPQWTILELPPETSDADLAALQSAFANELAPLTPNRFAFAVKTPLKILTPAYLAERDAAELNLHRLLQDRSSPGHETLTEPKGTK